MLQNQAGLQVSKACVLTNEEGKGEERDLALPRTGSLPWKCGHRGLCGQLDTQHFKAVSGSHQSVMCCSAVQSFKKKIK